MRATPPIFAFHKLGLDKWESKIEVKWRHTLIDRKVLKVLTNYWTSAIMHSQIYGMECERVRDLWGDLEFMNQLRREGGAGMEVRNGIQ